MKKRKTGRKAVLVGTVALLALGGSAFYVGWNRHAAQAPPPVAVAPAAETPTSPQGTDSDAVLPTQDIQPQTPAGGSPGEEERRPIAVYTVAVTDNGEHLEKRTLPAADIRGDSDEERATAALNAMAEEDQSPLPSGTHARSVTFEDDGVATVDFNKAFQSNFNGGDEAEAITLNAVLATVGQFAGVRSVQILIDGQKIDSLGGTQSLTKPLPIPQDVLTSGQDTATVAKSEP